MNPRHPIRSIGHDTEQPPLSEDHDGETWPTDPDAAANGTAISTDQAWADALPPSPVASERSLTRFMPAAALAITGVWTVFFLYAHWPRLTDGASALELANLVRDWVLPVVLVAVAWLVLMRSSAREARRFGHVAAGLEQQTRVLEDRLATVNRELGLARDFLSAETRELEFLGRAASERISEHAGTLQALIRDNGAQVDAIAGVSANALENMNRLRQDLPVVAASARDMTNQIGNVGRGAAEQIGQLTAEFERMCDAALANGELIESLKERTVAAIEGANEGVDALVAAADRRLAALRQGVDDFRRTMEAQEEEATAAVKSRTIRLGSELSAYHARLAEQEDAHMARLEERLAKTRDDVIALHTQIGEETEHANQAGQQRLDTLRDSVGTLLAEIEQLEREADAGSSRRLGAIRDGVGEVDNVLARRESRFAENLAERRRDWDEAEEAALARLAERMAAIDADLAARRQQEIAQTLMLTEHSEAIAAQLDMAAAQVDDVVTRTRTAQDGLHTGIDTLTQRLGEARELIDEADAALGSVAGASARVLELVQAGASQARGELNDALGDTAARIEQVNGRSETVAAILNDAALHSSQIEASLNAMEEHGLAVSTEFEDLRNTVTATGETQAAQLRVMRHELTVFQEDYAAAVQHLASSLRDAIETARAELAAALQAQADGQDQQVTAFAARLGEQSAAAIDTALEESGLKAADELAARMRQAAETGGGAVANLREQLDRIDELTGNLEARIAHAREQSEENIDHDFSRRVALITERLNSTAIDLDNVLSTEVSETAWTSYLKGDRGIFTRRAVRLLDNRDAREIADLYNSDGGFRGHVNRYVHDFEDMLRSLLSTRNGNALGVTILSSDMGKLYVALAQAIERLRQ